MGRVKRVILKTGVLSLLITVVILLVLVFVGSGTAQALGIAFTSLPTSGSLGSTYACTIRVDVEDTDLLPIKSVDLYMYKSDSRAAYEAHCDNLPLNTTITPYTRTSAQTASGTSPYGGAVSITASTAADWGYGYGYRGGYGYGYTPTLGYGYGYYYFGYGYGYGYGYSPYVGATSIEYVIQWTPPTAWPRGEYKIEVRVNANDTYFTQTSDEFTLSPRRYGVAVRAPAPTIETNLFGIEAGFRISDEGEILETITATSVDGNLTITIPEGTIALDKDGDWLSSLTTDVDPSPPDPPGGANIIGLAYNFGPDGATFDPAITLTWSYDPDDIPEGVAEEHLVIAYYNEAAGKWVECECTCDPETYCITASISHFTCFATISSARPLIQEYEATLAELEAAKAQTEIELAAAQAKVASLQDDIAAAQAKVSSSQSDIAAAQAKVASLQSDLSAAQARQAAAQDEVARLEAARGPNWGLIGGIIAAVVIAVLLVYFLWWRRRVA